MQAVGVDGYPRGWVAVSVRDAQFDAVIACADIEEVRATFATAACIGVDIPIGAPPSGLRPADELARQFVGPRRNSVFPTPPSRVLDETEYERAVAVYRELTGKGLSRQAFALFEKIREVARAPKEEPRVVEVHPEVSFAALKGAHLDEAKTTWNGFMERRGLLASAGVVLPDRLGARGVPLVDLLDAAVAAWSAHRCARGEARKLGGDGGAIWY